MRRAIIVIALLALLLLPGFAASARSTRHPHPSPTPAPTATPRPSSTIAPPTIAPVWAFDDEFSGTSLGSAWGHDWACCGSITMDHSLTTEPGDGYLHINVAKRNGAWFGDLVDTKPSFVRTYGTYQTRLRFPEGRGFWPAFWLYSGTFGTDGDEIDGMEVCANPNGTNGGNDVTVLHETVHKGTQGNQVYNPNADMGGDLSLDWHVYGIDWRAGYIAFSLDGKELWRESSLLISTPKAILLNLGVGGSWCGAADATTPASAAMTVDWVHVSP